MKKFLKTCPALALLACALAPCAFAQAQDAQPQSAKGGEAVRERRATNADAQKSAPDEKTADAPKGEPSAKNTDSDVDALRAQVASAASASEKGRLEQALAARLIESGRKTEAVELLRSMLSEDRFDPPFFYNTGNALARLDETNAAVDAYRKAVAQRHGNYSRAQHNLGVVLTRLGRWDEAEEALGTALRLENDNYAEASYSLGRLHALRGEAGLAIAEWERTLRINPDHADAAVALARALAEDGDPDRALSVLDSFAERAGRRGTSVPREITVTRGEIVAASLVAEDDKGKNSGDRLRDTSAARGPGESNAASRASASDSLAIMRGARASSKNLRTLVVNKQSYSFLLDARRAREESRNDDAVALYRRAIQNGGGYMAPANLELGFTLITLRRNEEAIAALLAVVRRDGTRYPVVFYHLGRIYEHLGRTDEAAEAFARAVELMGEENPQFFVDLSRVRERQGRYADALAAAERYVSLTAQTGDAPAWARDLVTRLRKKVGQNAAQPASAKN